MNERDERELDLFRVLLGRGITIKLETPPSLFGTIPSVYRATQDGIVISESDEYIECMKQACSLVDDDDEPDPSGGYVDDYDEPDESEMENASDWEEQFGDRNYG